MADSEWLLAYIKGSTAVAASGDDVTDEAQENRRKGEGEQLAFPSISCDSQNLVLN